MIVLSNIATLSDGRSAEASALHHGVDLLLEGERVHAVEAHRPERPLAQGDTLVDASAWTITPGLVDCHGHITALGLTSADIERSNGLANQLWVEKVLYTSLVDGGVTAMRDVGGATSQMKRWVEEGLVIGPHLAVSICMLSSTGGHADFRGPDRCHAEISRLWPPAPGRPSSIVDSPWDARTRVRELGGSGADLIKLCTSPGVASPGDKLEHRDLHEEEIAAICEEADARGLSVAAHAHSKSGIRLAIDHGVHDLQHISYMDAELVELADARGCVVTPTSWVIDALLASEGLSDFVMEKVKQVAEVHKHAVAFAASGGLPILAGTDPVLPGMHGRNYYEIRALARDGLSGLRAWHGMTGLAAREVGFDDRGELRAGALADLLVWTGDVVADPELLGPELLHEVVQDGSGYRAGIDALPQRRFETGLRDAMWPNGHPG